MTYTTPFHKSDLEIIAVRLAEMLSIQPRWMKLKQAAAYSSIGEKRLKTLAECGDIIGYQDLDSKRGDWVFDRYSLDEYRLTPVRKNSVKLNKILDGIKRGL